MLVNCPDNLSADFLTSAICQNAYSNNTIEYIATPCPPLWRLCYSARRSRRPLRSARAGNCNDSPGHSSANDVYCIQPPPRKPLLWPILPYLGLLLQHHKLLSRILRTELPGNNSRLKRCDKDKTSSQTQPSQHLLCRSAFGRMYQLKRQMGACKSCWTRDQCALRSDRP